MRNSAQTKTSSFLSGGTQDVNLRQVKKKKIPVEAGMSVNEVPSLRGFKYPSVCTERLRLPNAAREQ